MIDRYMVENNNFNSASGKVALLKKAIATLLDDKPIITLSTVQFSNKHCLTKKRNSVHSKTRY